MASYGFGDALRRELGLSRRCGWCGELEAEDGRLGRLRAEWSGEDLTVDGTPVMVCLGCAATFLELRHRHDAEVREDARS